MRKFSFAILISAAFVLLDSCKKCYTCQNECKICTDNHYTIRVCSDVFTMPYYKEYIDSLTDPSLGWVCRDTSATTSHRFCGRSNSLFDETNKGYVCY